MNSTRKWPWAAGFVTVAGLIIVLIVLSDGRQPQALEGVNAESLGISINTQPLPRGSVTTSYAPAVKPAASSVVSIYATEIVKKPAARANGLADSFLNQLFGGDQNAPEVLRQQSLGSGVIVSRDGYILTNNHVINGAQTIRVVRADDSIQVFPGRVIGADSLTDLAVVKIEEKNLPAITFGDSDQLDVGDVVLAIGNPFGIGQTVTTGIVSALNRSGLGLEPTENFIQTDATINPGNSGGALIDAEGRLVGINTAMLASKEGGYEGIGFAIPANLALKVMTQLLEYGKVVRGYLGITVQRLTPELAEQFGVPQNTRGALVADVNPGTPAAKAGIQSGDIIVAVDGKQVTGGQDLRGMISEMQPGSKADLSILRNGRPQTLTATIEEMTSGPADSHASSAPAAMLPPQDGTLGGVVIASLDPEVRQTLKIPDGVTGAVVADIDPNSTAYLAGLRVGDVIQQINHRPVTDAQQAMQLGKDVKSAPTLLLVWTPEGSAYVVVEPSA